ncbi:TetR/AcrR family transcriptional regulator [Nocardiopsis sp. EMB25]|uniref:TetR/AcrR family transcriptional regulator n=1 Tax=Nocardiopsis TaxID=2013 RepID=UPI00034C68AF|nr:MULTISPECIES: TetR/AcrR family transcriptional regulator [Nocardiopsis]MCY9782660.1 TetR/AcrR family transcriptional regulator [Nocardiopsis sp. EMB25]
MTPSTRPTSRTDKRVQRAERILDAAGELLVSWGYPRITIEDVARRAGIGKGTVYLHFPTKEALFLVVVLRAQRAMVERVLEVMRQGPEGIWPSTLARTTGLALHDSAIIAAVMRGRAETLGTLSQAAEEYSRKLVERRLGITEAYFDLLRDHGLIRTDRPRDEQLYAYSSILTGFLISEPLLSERFTFPPPTVDRHVDILADTIRSTLGESDADGALHTVWPRVTALFEELVRDAHAEVDRYTHATRDT